MVEELGAEAPLAGVRTVLQTAATGYIYDPDITTVVYGFTGRPWPTFMAGVDDCKPTPCFTATTALLLNQLSRPVKATACEIDVNEPFHTETLQLLQSWESSWNTDLKLVTKSISREWERLWAVTIDGRAKMANMRSFVSRTERRRGAAQFITVTSSLVTDEEVDETTEEAGRTVKAPVFTVYTTGCSFIYIGYKMCWHSSLLSLVWLRLGFSAYTCTLAIVTWEQNLYFYCLYML